MPLQRNQNGRRLNHFGHHKQYEVDFDDGNKNGQRFLDSQQRSKQRKNTAYPKQVEDQKENQQGKTEWPLECGF